MCPGTQQQRWAPNAEDRGNLASLFPETDDLARSQDRFARVAWSRLSEPGDGVAGLFVATLGAAEALRHLADGRSAAWLADRLSDAAPTRQELRRRLAPALERWLPRLNREEISADLGRARLARIRALTPAAECWPPGLHDLGVHAPMMLWYRGNPALLPRAQLAVVGSRAASPYGEHVTATLSEAAIGAGFGIVSGAAYGIDGVAHRTALACSGETTAVLAGGVDRSYPRGHDALLGRIREHGVVCSELVPGQAPTRWRFLQRNRLIAALGRATLVCEAGQRSGSLNTAGHAVELGRPLGAVPGPVTAAGSSGCHWLIRERGATLVGGAADLRELLGAGGAAELGPVEHSPAGSDVQRRLLDALPLRGAVSASELSKRAGLSPGEAAGAIAELALLGTIIERAGQWKRASNRATA